MKGTRIGIRLIRHDPQYGGRVGIIELGGRVLHIQGEITMPELAEALHEIETTVNEQLPFLRLHVSIEEVG